MTQVGERAGASSWVARAVRGQGRMCAVLVRGLRGQREIPPGGVPIGYGQVMRPMLIAFLVLTPVEIAVVELFVGWTWLRLALLVLAVYGVLLLGGLLAALRVCPHVVGPRTLLVRSGPALRAEVPLAEVVAVELTAGSGYRRSLAVDNDEVAVPVNGYTSVLVRLRPGTLVAIAGRAPVVAGALCFDADEPAAAVAAVNAALARTPAGRGANYPR